MKKKKLSSHEQFAYVFVLSQYIDTLKEMNKFDKREKAKILKLLDSLKSQGIFIDNLEPIFNELNSIPDEEPESANVQKMGKQ